MLDGQPIIKAARQPFRNAARALLALGYDPARLIEASHRGSAIVAMRSTMGHAAMLTIEESDKGGLRKRLWKPFKDADSSRAVEARSGAHPSQASTAGAAQLRVSLPPHPALSEVA